VFKATKFQPIPYTVVDLGIVNGRKLNSMEIFERV
jgi:hypothetical protein